MVGRARCGKPNRQLPACLKDSSFNLRHPQFALCLMLDDTIAAIATPLGEGGLAVIRVSGPNALGIADKIFSPVGKSSVKPSEASSHTVQFGHVVRDGKVIDEVLVTV